MTDWTPPEAMVEEVAQQVLERLFTVNPTTKPGIERVAREVVRAALAASPIGELTKAANRVRALLLDRCEQSDLMTDDDAEAIRLLDAALARARGET